jgi:DNA-binding CsgD family transcriptional regulator
MTYHADISLSPLRLSPRETEVMTWTARGKTCYEIALLLAISEETVRAHVRNICHKTNAANKTHATVIALTNNLIPGF